MRMKDHGIRRVITIATLVFLLASTAIIWGTYNSYVKLSDRTGGQLEEQSEETLTVSLFKRIPIPDLK